MGGSNLYILDGSAAGTSTIRDQGGAHTVLLPFLRTDAAITQADGAAEIVSGDYRLRIETPHWQYTLIFLDGERYTLAEWLSA